MTAQTYHLVWTTYGTWLPGDARGWIRKKSSGIQAPNKKREQHARQRMAEQPVVLTLPQRSLVEQTIREHIQIRNWRLHAVNVRSNHVHVVVAADCDAGEVMSQLKAWCARRLSDSVGLEECVGIKAGRRRWFTEGGERRIIEDEQYFENAVRYVMEGQ